MPVWHGLSKSWREQQGLVVLGIAQEQHRDRCELWALWQDIDWPILWDPLNLTGAKVVPNVFALDEAGVVVAISPSPEWVESEFLPRAAAETLRAPASEAASVAGNPELVELTATSADDAPRRALWSALSALVFAPGDGPAIDRAERALLSWLGTHPDDAAARFRLGVVLRLRAEIDARRPDDFARALEAWAAALAARPDAYIWRRRIQQYGPTLDKPYPFYPWIEEALAALEQRGQRSPQLSATLTESERVAPRRSFADSEQTSPDPDGKLPRDTGNWLQAEWALAFDTGDGSSARVHLTLRPSAERGVHWGNEGGPTLVWFGDGALPDGWRLDRRLVTLPRPADALSSEPRSAELELSLPVGEAGEVKVYVLASLCADDSGVCTYLRRDLTLAIPAR